MKKNSWMKTKDIVNEVKETINEARFLIKEANSVSYEVEAEAYNILDMINKHLHENHPIKNKDGYEIAFDDFLCHPFGSEKNNLRIVYYIVNTYTKEVYNALGNVFDKHNGDFSNDRSTWNYPHVVFRFVALRDSVKSTYNNMNAIVHELMHFYQQYKSGVTDIIRNRRLYDFAISEAEKYESGTLRSDLGYAIYASFQPEIDANVQGLSEYMKSHKIKTYRDSAAYRTYLFIKNVKEVLDNIKERNGSFPESVLDTKNSMYDATRDNEDGTMNVIELINGIYKHVGMNFNKIYKMVSFGESYFIQKIGNVVGLYYGKFAISK